MMLKIFRLVLVAVIGVGLMSCTSAREELRFTYDPQRIVPGATRSEIEEQLGSPKRLIMQENGETVSYYETSKISPRSKRTMLARMEAVDILTLGVGEFLNPFGLRNNERKRFAVQYDQLFIARSISVYCLASDGSRGERNPLQLTEATVSNGWTCNRAGDGL